MNMFELTIITLGVVLVVSRIVYILSLPEKTKSTTRLNELIEAERKCRNREF